MDYLLAMSVLRPKYRFSVEDTASSFSSGNLSSISESLASYAMQRLEAYPKNLVEHHMTEVFVYELAHSYFWEKIPVSLSYVEAAVLICIGLQGKDISTTQEEMEAKNQQQIISIYLDVMRKFYKYLRRLSSKENPTSSRLKDIVMKPHPISLEDDLNDGAKLVQDNTRSKLDKEDDFESALKTSGGKVLSGGVISVKSNKSKAKKESSEKKRSKLDHSSKSNKKRKS